MVRVSFDKLQHIYDLHAGDFELSGNKNSIQLGRLSDALESHLVDRGTRRVPGKYRGADATLYFNPQTRNVLVTDGDEHVIAAFKASPTQTGYILSKGKLS